MAPKMLQLAFSGANIRVLSYPQKKKAIFFGEMVLLGGNSTHSPSFLTAFSPFDY